MAKIKKKSKRTIPASTKRIAPPGRAEPAYIDISQDRDELAAKSRLLWLIVAVFSVILAVFWLVILRINIQKETADIGFSQIGRQITESLARFDTEIKNRPAAKTISAEDLSAIKTDLEEQIKNDPDSSLWPTHDTLLGFSIQYPAGWKKSESDKEITLTDAVSGISTADDSGRIVIIAKSNAKKYNLVAWWQNNKTLTAGYEAERPLVPDFSNWFENLMYASSSVAADRLDKIIYLNATSTKTVWEIKITAGGDIGYYEPLLEEIIRTIRIIKN